MGSIEADGLLRLMNQQHAQNRGDIEALKEGQSHLANELSNLAGQISGATGALRFIGWIILAVFAGLTVWFASLELRGKVSSASPPAISSTQPAPQDAGIKMSGYVPRSGP